MYTPLSLDELDAPLIDSVLEPGQVTERVFYIDNLLVRIH